MSSKIECPGCRNRIDWDGGNELTCPYCGEIISEVKSLLENNLIERLGIAAGYRRVGRFDDSQQELENILESHENLADALFGCFLNAYEISEYSFDKDNKVKICKCNSTSGRPVEMNKDWQTAKEIVTGNKRKQWVALGEKIEELRKYNIRIKHSLPRYKAILVCDFENELDMDAAHGLYKILMKKTDIFFPPETLKDVPFEERERYFIQVLKNPEIAPYMFVIYSDSFNYRNKAKQFFSNIAGQCREFAKVHTKGELISVTCDYEPSAFMKSISVKTIKCKNFDSKSYEEIAGKIFENILDAYDDEEYERYESGETVKLNKVLSPKVCPLSKT